MTSTLIESPEGDQHACPRCGRAVTICLMIGLCLAPVAQEFGHPEDHRVASRETTVVIGPPPHHPADRHEPEFDMRPVPVAVSYQSASGLRTFVPARLISMKRS
jgi:hypothetical protein